MRSLSMYICYAFVSDCSTRATGEDCRKLVGCPTEKSQVNTFSTNIFLTSVQVQLYPVTGKTYKNEIYMY